MATKRFGLDSTFKQLAALLSGGAALASILSFVIDRRPPAVEVDRLEVLPAIDTAFALGDTVRLTVMAADARGVSMIPSRITWQTNDSTVAVVDSGGRVRALRRGQTLITVAAGGRLARARVWVLPRVTELIIPGDSVIRVAEGQSQRLQVIARDARRNRITAPGLQWTVADRAVASIDSTGELRALTPGASTVSATFAELLVQRRLEVSPVPASLTLGGGEAQRAAAGERLPAALAVQVVSRSGRPVPQVMVRFDAGSSGGHMAPDTALSDSAGVARSRWRLGSRPGRQQVLVSVVGIDSPLVVTAEADPLAITTRVTVWPDSLSAGVLETLGRPVVVQLTDTSGIALADVPVAWRPLDGGDVVALSARSDSLGQVQGRWTLGPKAGPQRLHIQVGNPSLFPHRIVTAEARSGPAARLMLVGGNAQRGTVGQTIPQEVVLRVTDSLDNPVNDAPIQFRRTGQPAKDSVIKSTRDGRVTLRWTLTRKAGPDGYTVRIPGSADSIRLSATARPGPVDSISFVTPPATAVAGRALAKALEVRVADRFGNPVPGAALRFSATGGRLSPAKAVTDSLGVATVRWTAGTRIGPQTLNATVAGGTAQARHAVRVGAPPSTSRASTSTTKPAAKGRVSSR